MSTSGTRAGPFDHADRLTRALRGVVSPGRLPDPREPEEMFRCVDCDGPADLDGVVRHASDCVSGRVGPTSDDTTSLSHEWRRRPHARAAER
jgi:hypothetical protein